MSQDDIFWRKCYFKTRHSTQWRNWGTGVAQLGRNWVPWKDCEIPTTCSPTITLELHTESAPNVPCCGIKSCYATGLDDVNPAEWRNRFSNEKKKPFMALRTFFFADSAAVGGRMLLAVNSINYWKLFMGEYQLSLTSCPSSQL